MTDPMQFLAVGTVGGDRSRAIIHTADTTSSLIFSFPGSGKSAFAQSNPNAIIINTDFSPPVWFPEEHGLDPAHRAFIWPHDLPELQDRPWNLRNMYVTAERIHEFLGKLCDVGPKHRNHVVFDSIGTLTAVLKPWVAAQIRPSGSKLEFDQLHGMQAYGKLNATLAAMYTTLKRAGFVPHAFAHLKTVKKEIEGAGEIITTEHFTHSLSDGQWGALEPLPDLIGILQQDQKPGKTRRDGTRGPMEKNVCLRVEDPSHKAMLKNRPELPSVIDLPLSNPWGSYAATFGS